VAGARLLQARRDGGEMPLVVGDELRVALGGESFGQIECTAVFVVHSAAPFKRFDVSSRPVGRRQYAHSAPPKLRGFCLGSMIVNHADLRKRTPVCPGSALPGYILKREEAQAASLSCFRGRRSSTGRTEPEGRALDRDGPAAAARFPQQVGSSRQSLSREVIAAGRAGVPRSDLRADPRTRSGAFHAARSLWAGWVRSPGKYRFVAIPCHVSWAETRIGVGRFIKHLFELARCHQFGMLILIHMFDRYGGTGGDIRRGRAGR
jgi:hypothetical protein